MNTSTLLRRNRRSDETRNQLPIYKNSNNNSNPTQTSLIRRKSSKRGHLLCCCRNNISPGPAVLCTFLFLVVVLVGISIVASTRATTTTTTNESHSHISIGEIQQTVPVNGIYDVAVLGAGPAGLTAALFAARAGLSVIVLGSQSGLLSETPRLDNFPSFVHDESSKSTHSSSTSRSTSGTEWLLATRNQAIQFGATFALPGLLALSLKQEQDLASDPNVFVLPTQLKAFRSYSVIVATGAKPRHLGLPMEDQLWGNSLHSCAICDGNLYKDKTVLVVGGGDAAMDAAILLARQAKKVVLVHRRTEFTAKHKASIQLVQETSNNIDILTPFVVSQWEIDASDQDNHQLIGARIKRKDDNGVLEAQDQFIPCDGAFLMIGATPNTEWLVKTVNDDTNTLELDQEGLIKLQQEDGTYTTDTSLPGVFAAGEVTDNRYKQAVTAAAAGAQAAMDAERWLRQGRAVVVHHNNDKQAVDRRVVVGLANNSDPVHMVKQQTQIQEAIAVEAVPETPSDDKDDDCDLTVIDCIQRVVKKYPVVVFSKPWCPYCRRALEALTIAGMANPHVIDLSTFGDQTRSIQTTLKRLTGRRTVPNVFVGGKSIGGGDETVAMQAQGKLVPLLQQVGAIANAVTRKPSNKNTQEEECDMTSKECIMSTVNKFPVVLFSLSWCPECVRILELLHLVGVTEPYIIDLGDFGIESQDIRYQLMQMTGRRSVPNLFIGGENIGGEKIAKKLHQSDMLIRKLKEAKAI